jgi:hypothetical protein
LARLVNAQEANCPGSRGRRNTYRHLPDRAASSFTACHDKTAAKVSHLHSISQRLTAHTPVTPALKLEAFGLAAQRLKLVGQDRDLDVLGVLGLVAPKHEAEVSAHHQVIDVE